MWNDECNNDKKKEMWDRKKEKIMKDRLLECVLECIKDTGRNRYL